MDVVAQLQSTLGERYAILREIGTGGMATVFLAQDRKHERRVAVKVLNPELGAVLGVERFLAEIRVTANLQHPNLLPLFDSGEANGLLFYVMPFVEGESLRVRLSREKQLPVAEAVAIARAVADSLDYAHRHGVIHRDLKPENILLHEGRPLVADFGIALAVSNAGGARITQTGLSLGTPHYMSPEQATGDRAIDGRSDIYSLAAVLYEMLTGEPPYTGPTSQAVIARVFTEQPRPVRLTRPSVPPQIEEAVGRALAKLPADRFATTRDFVEALDGRGAPGAGVEPPTSPRATTGVWRGRFTRLVQPVTIAVMAALGAWGWYKAGHVAPLTVVRFAVQLAPNEGLWAISRGNSLAVAPDGKTIAYVGGVGPNQLLSVRTLDNTAARTIPGTDYAFNPTFSPDGRSLAFTAGGELKRVSLDGGPVVSIIDLRGHPGTLNGIDWGSNDSILVAWAGDIALIPANGGGERWITSRDSHTPRGTYQWPRYSPTSRWILYTDYRGVPTDAHIVARSARDTMPTAMSVPGIMALGFIDDRLVYSSASGMLMGIRFDESTGRASGDPIPLGDSASRGPQTIVKAALSSSGTLAFLTGAFSRQIVALDLAGTMWTAIPEVRPYTFIRFSPDGQRLAMSVQTAREQQISVYEFSSRTLTRLTTVGSSNQRPEWTPDGKRIVFRSDQGGSSLLWQPYDGSGPAEQVIAGPESDNVWEGVVSPDGRTIAYRTGAVGSSVIWLRTLGDSTTPPKPLGEPRFTEWGPQFSPNGRWLAFSSNKGGAQQVYVQPVAAGGGRIQISAEEGADTPMWSRDGRRIFYVVQGERLVQATLDPGPPIRVIDRKTVVDGGFYFAPGHATFDVSPNGRELLLLKSLGGAEFVVANNWNEQVRARIRAASATRKR